MKLVVFWVIALLVPLGYYALLRLVLPGRFSPRLLRIVAAVGAFAELIVLVMFAGAAAWLVLAIHLIVFGLAVQRSRNRFRLHSGLVGLASDEWRTFLSVSEIQQLMTMITAEYPRTETRIELGPDVFHLTLSVGRYHLADVALNNDWTAAWALQELVKMHPQAFRIGVSNNPTIVTYRLLSNGAVQLSTKP